MSKFIVWLLNDTYVHHMKSKFKTQCAFLSTISLQTSPQFQSRFSHNDHIASLCKQKQYKQALSFFSSLQLQNPNCDLYPSTYTHLFIACSNLKSLKYGKIVHDHLTQYSNLNADVILNNHILNMYGKCGSLSDAHMLFDKMPARNIVSWTSMISGYTQNHRENEALWLYVEMLRSGLSPDAFCMGSVVRSCWGLCDAELGRQIHCQVLKFDYGSERIVQNAIVTMYSKFGKVEDAGIVFERIGEKDLTSWGSMITGFTQQNFEFKALLLFKEMLRNGNIVPNEYHFGSIFSACSCDSNLTYGEQVHGLCLKFNFARDEVAGCSLSKMYAKFGKLDGAKKAFYQIETPDLFSWNSVICAFADEGFIHEARLVFSRMRDMEFEPDDITLKGLIRSCTNSNSLTQGELMHSYVAKMGYGLHTSICNTLLDMYSKCSNFLTASSFFKEMKGNSDLVSWNTILSACLQHQKPEKIFELCKLMNMSYSMDHITLNTILRACGELSYAQMVDQIHAHASKLGLEGDLMVKNGLIDSYAKCGSLDDSRKLFSSMGDESDVFSWSSLIVGYAQLGYGEQSLELFNTMKKLGITPNHVTFVGVLSACSRIGLVDEGLHYYNVMENEYGVVPTREHCSIVIDLLARAGKLKEAEKFMHTIPFEPDIIMWKTLLSASRSHNNLEIADRAKNGILKLDPYSSAAYVLSCNTFASSGCWDDVAKLRRLMRNNGVRKIVAKSWIEIKGEVKVFIVEDRSHFESEIIYEILDVLGYEMGEDSQKAESFIVCFEFDFC